MVAKMRANIFNISVLICFITIAVYAEKPTTKQPKSWKDKDVRDMTDADMERLLDQWEENEEPLEPDELPEHLRPAPKIDLTKIDPTNTDSVLRMTKQGKGVMMFVDVKREISEEQAEVVMKIWQTSLQNNHIIAERYPIDPNRSIFMFREGSQAVDAKNYLLEQPELAHLTLEGQTFHPNDSNQNDKQSKKSEKKARKTEL